MIVHPLLSMSLPHTNKQLNYCYSESGWGGGGGGGQGVITVKNQEKFPFRFEIYPSNAEATFIKSTRMQRFLKII